MCMCRKIREKLQKWNEMLQEILVRVSPPGYEIAGEYRSFWIYLCSCVIYSLSFFFQYQEEYEALYYWKSEGLYAVRTLRPDGRMPLFVQILDGSLLFFAGGVLLLGTFVLMRFLHYRRESRSIYVMKRLKDRSILYRSYYQAPLILGGILLTVMLLLVAVYYLFYLAVTPKTCLYV